MKKTLAIMLTLILTFSCFSILGISTVSAETQQVGQVILESDFNDADGTNWQATHQTVTYSDDNGDGVNDYASVKVSSTKKGAGLVSSPFNLIPGNEYELTYYIRVPEESVSFKIGSTFYTPTTIFYQPTVNSEGTRVSSTPAVSTEEASNNYYAYKGSDWVRREGFKSTWTIDGYEPTVKSNFSNFGYSDHGSVLSATNTDLNEAFANWTKVTVNFTAMASVEGETSQVTALAFTFHDYKSSDNFVFDLKDVKLVCTDDGTETKTIMQSDFNDADGTNWQATKADAPLVTYGDDNSDGVNDYARVKIHPTSKNQGLVSSPFNLIPGNEYELTYYIRVPEETADGETASFLIGSTFYAPTVAFYQPTVNSTGTKVTSTPSVTTAEASNNYYAYKGSDWSRREGFAATWTIDGYEPTVKSNFSNFGYNDHGSVLGATNETINDAFAEWTKVTVNFTAMAAVEGETSQVAALSFTFHDYKSTDNFVFDIKDVTLTETAAIEEEKPEEIVIPELPDYPALPDVETPTGNTYTTTVTGENCNAFVSEETAIEGSKVIVSAAPKAGYKFTGWYENDELVSTEKLYTFAATENRTLIAKCEILTEDNKEITVYPDVNYDGKVALDDVTKIAQYFAGWNVKNINGARLDVDGDGKANLNDLVLIAQYVAQWDVEDDLAKKQGYVLPDEDLTSDNLEATVLAGQSEYFNTSAIANEGNMARIAKVLKKAEAGEPITVVSLGGSITQGVKDGNGNDRSYGKLVSEWFETKFGITVTNINAGIGSTGSLIGVHRLKIDVLDHNPDLVLLDYCVNDISSANAKIPYKETYESIIRTLLEKDIAVMTVVFGSANATTPKFFNDYMGLHLPSMLYYDLPVIDFYGALWRYIDNDIIEWYDKVDGVVTDESLTRDGLHPSITGHKMISSAMNYYLENVLNKLETIDETIYAIPEDSLFENADLYKTATFYASSDDLGYEKIEPYYNADFTVGQSVHGAKLGKGWICSSGSGVIVFDIQDATSLTLSMMESKTTNGVYSVTINGETIRNNATTGTSGDHIWPIFSRTFDTPQDIVITVTCHSGTVGIGPIGVTY